jgi:hypothetical protein
MDKQILELLLDKLPPFIQKRNKLCKLQITKDNSHYIIKYTNATEDLHDFDSDLTTLTIRILQKLSDLKGIKGYIIKEK